MSTRIGRSPSRSLCSRERPPRSSTESRSARTTFPWGGRPSSARCISSSPASRDSAGRSALLVSANHLERGTRNRTHSHRRRRPRRHVLGLFGALQSATHARLRKRARSFSRPTQGKTPPPLVLPRWPRSTPVPRRIGCASLGRRVESTVAVTSSGRSSKKIVIDEAITGRTRLGGGLRVAPPSPWFGRRSGSTQRPTSSDRSTNRPTEPPASAPVTWCATVAPGSSPKKRLGRFQRVLPKFAAFACGSSPAACAPA